MANPLQTQINTINEKINKARELVKTSTDETIILLAKEELEKLTNQKSLLERVVKDINKQPKTSVSTPNNETQLTGNCIMEIRAGTGGNEAGLFAHSLYNMYLKFAEKQGWKTSQLSKNEGGIGNIKEVVFEISSSKTPTPFELLQHESGVHRVQRIPTTESSGRIHTSTATVAVLPTVSNTRIEIKPEDLHIDTFRASSAGGQHVNKTESAIRITHKPTGVIVQCQDERSQHKNREKAMTTLQAKLYDLMKKQQKNSIDELRTGQVGTGERSEKIRTYNFPQDRITDHRIKKSWFGIEKILTGNIKDILQTLHEEINS